MALYPIPRRPRWSNGTPREDRTGLLQVWAQLVQAVTVTLPDALYRIAYAIDSHR